MFIAQPRASPGNLRLQRGGDFHHGALVGNVELRIGVARNRRDVVARRKVYTSEPTVIEWLPDNGLKPDVVSGVSIGAINATVLCGIATTTPRLRSRRCGRISPRRACPRRWTQRTNALSVFGNPGMYVPRIDHLNFWLWTSFYDTGPLRWTLDRYVDFDKLGPSNFSREPRVQAPRLILTATNLLSGKLDRCDSKQLQITPAHVAASGSLPPSFPATLALAPEEAGGGEQLYWAGGLFDNTPLSKVIAALEESPDRRDHQHRHQQARGLLRGDHRAAASRRVFCRGRQDRRIGSVRRVLLTAQGRGHLRFRDPTERGDWSCHLKFQQRSGRRRLPWRSPHRPDLRCLPDRWRRVEGTVTDRFRGALQILVQGYMDPRPIPCSKYSKPLGPFV